MRMVAVLSAALLMWCLASFAQTNSTYEGKTDSLNAEFVLHWSGGGDRVTGYYHTNDDPTQHYRLVGHNYHDGRLILKEYDQGQVTAVIRLRKTVRGNQIRWSGRMYNTDGRRIPVSFTRM
jgi:hypothetical protein